MPNKHILLGISGGIAAYKSCELVRLLRKQGHTVSVAMSRAAAGFVSPQTFQALSGHTVWTDDTADSADGMAHIHLSREADVFLIAPASANTLAKIAHGMADNLLSTLAAARNCPLAVAPAMNVEMWRNPANLRNIAQLQADGITVFGPASGSQAGEAGEFDEFDTPAAQPAWPVTRELQATLCWLDDEPLTPGRVYWALHGHRWLKAKARRVLHRLDIHTLQPQNADRLEANAIGQVELALQEAIPAAPFATSRTLGALILVDAATHRTAAAALAG